MGKGRSLKASSLDVVSMLLTFEKTLSSRSIPMFGISSQCRLIPIRETVEAIAVPVISGHALPDKRIKFKRLDEAPAEARRKALAKFE
jgi:hypothetical protein